MKYFKILLFIGLLAGFNRMDAQALLIYPSDTVLYTTSLTGMDSNSSGQEQYRSVINQSGVADTVCWKLQQAIIDTAWSAMSMCDPNNCYYFSVTGTGGSTHEFVSDTGSYSYTGDSISGYSYRLQFGSAPQCTADSGEFQILMWLKNDSAASVNLITYKALYTGSCATAAITEVAANDIKIYPSPVNTQLTVEGLDNLNQASVLIYDVLGNVVLHKEFTIPQSTINLNTSALVDGVYIVGVESNGTRLLTKRIEKFE